MTFTLNRQVCEAQSVAEPSIRRRVLVTGASSGIGEAFARQYATQGCDVVLVARNSEQLERVAADVRRTGAKAEIIVADLSSRDGVEMVGERCGNVDVLVANAGVTHAAAVGTTNRDTLDRIAYLMSAGVVRLCEIIVPRMLERGGGDVVIVSSIASFTPMRKAGPYAAAKSHATAYARSLAMEVGQKGVRVVAVCPGYVRTELHGRAGLDHLARKVPSWMWLTSEQVVHATMRALRRGKTVLVPGAVYRIVLPFLSSSLAQGVWRRLTRRS
jgi:short-subunit dehydrogenase